MISLYQGHALEVISKLDDSIRFDALITDPPYASGNTLASKAQSTATKYTAIKRMCPYPDFDGDAMDQRSWAHMMAGILHSVRRRCNPSAVCAIFIDWRNLPSLTDAMQMAGWIWRGVAVWDKVNCRPQMGRYKQQAEFVVWGSNGDLPVSRPVPILPGVFRHTIVQPKDRYHQTQKPLELMREIIRICVPGGYILDPFAGSGSTLAAAEMDGYEAIGIETSATIAQIASDRLGVPIITL